MILSNCSSSSATTDSSSSNRSISASLNDSGPSASVSERCSSLSVLSVCSFISKPRTSPDRLTGVLRCRAVATISLIPGLNRIRCSVHRARVGSIHCESCPWPVSCRLVPLIPARPVHHRSICLTQLPLLPMHQPSRCIVASPGVRPRSPVNQAAGLSAPVVTKPAPQRLTAGSAPCHVRWMKHLSLPAMPNRCQPPTGEPYANHVAAHPAQRFRRCEKTKSSATPSADQIELDSSTDETARSK